MSAAKNAKQERKATSGSGKWTQYNPNGLGDAPAWEEVEATAVLSLIYEATGDGDAVLFGVTRDGGTLVLTLCSGDERGKYYARTGDEMSKHIATLLALAKE